MTRNDIRSNSGRKKSSRLINSSKIEVPACVAEARG